MYPPYVVGGAEKVVEMLAEAQVAKGHHVGAAYLSQVAEPVGMRHGVEIMPQASRNLVWVQDVFRAARAVRTANKLVQMIDIRAAQDFGRAMAAFRPDIVHTHSMVELPPMIWSHIAASGARAVHTLHDYDLICSRASRFRDGRNCDALHPSCRITGQWKGRFARSIDAVAAVSTQVLDEHRRFGLFKDLPPERAQTIWNAARITPEPPRPSPPRTGPIIFGFMGRLVPEKGILTLLEACHLLPSHGWRLKVAGHAQEGDAAYRDQAGALSVDFLGFTDPTAFLRSIDVLVVPSIWREPFGLTVIEAFAQGVAVIGSDLGAVPELIAPIGPDWIVPAGSPHALADRMRQVLAQGRSSFPKPASFTSVLDRVSPERMVAGYEALYQNALHLASAA